MFFPPKPQFSKLLGLLWFWREEQNSEFPKTFFGGYLFVFVEYVYNRSPKIKTKNIKHYSPILAIVNYRNWLDDSPLLRFNENILDCLLCRCKLAAIFLPSASYWNDRRSRRVFLCFCSAIFQLTSSKFQTFAYNSRTVGPSYMKFGQQFEINELYFCTKFRGNRPRDFGFRTRKPTRKFVIKSDLSQKRLKYGKKHFI